MCVRIGLGYVSSAIAIRTATATATTTAATARIGVGGNTPRTRTQSAFTTVYCARPLLVLSFFASGIHEGVVE